MARLFYSLGVFAAGAGVFLGIDLWWHGGAVTSFGLFGLGLAMLAVYCQGKHADRREVERRKLSGLLARLAERRAEP